MFLHIIVFPNCLCFVSCVYWLNVIKVCRIFFFTIVNKTEKKQNGGEGFPGGGGGGGGKILGNYPPLGGAFSGRGGGGEDILLHRITVWIHEFFQEYFIIALLSNIGGVGPWWKHVLSEYSCYDGIQ